VDESESPGCDEHDDGAAACGVAMLTLLMGDTGLEPVTSALSSSLALGMRWLYTAAQSQM